MNERIKELAVQAGAVYYTRLGRETNLVELQKFAELIVKECARVVDNLTEQDNPIEYRRTYAQGADVLEHFGVNE
jgi:hypothetical protein